MTTVSLFIIVMSKIHPKCSSADEYKMKSWCIYTMWYYSAVKKNETMKCAAKWMVLELIIPNEAAQTQTTLHSFSYM